MGAPECGGRDMPQAASTTPTGAQSGLGGSPLRAAGGQPYRRFRCPSTLGTSGTARPRPVSCSRFRRQIETLALRFGICETGGTDALRRSPPFNHRESPAEAGEPSYLGAVSRLSTFPDVAFRESD